MVRLFHLLRKDNQVLFIIWFISFLGRANVRAFHEQLNRIHTELTRKFCQRGSKFDNVFFFFFLVDYGRNDPNTTLSGPSTAC